MTTAPHATLTRYMLALGAHFAAGGVMSVAFPWIITYLLHESDARVGLAQFIATLPLMCFVLIGGANADGRNLRVYISRLQLGTAVLPIVLATVAALHMLSFGWTVTVVFAISTLSAFIMPARDALLSHVSPPSLGLARTAALATAANFGGQAFGLVIAGAAALFGVVPLLCLQSILLVFAAVMTAGLRYEMAPAPPITERERLSRLWHELRDGVRVVRDSERLRTLILYLSLGSPLFNGMFLVGVPLMVRDVYHLNARSLAFVMVAFLVGLTVSSFSFSHMRPVERPGRLLMLLSPNNILVFAIAHFAPPFPFFVGLMLWWGLISGVAMSLTRGMIQVAAPNAYRARVLSVLQFANIAGSPPGALLFGLVSQAVGILNTLLIVPVVVAILWIAFRFFSPLWEFKREDGAHEAAIPAAS